MVYCYVVLPDTPGLRLIITRMTLTEFPAVLEAVIIIVSLARPESKDTARDIPGLHRNLKWSCCVKEQVL